MSNTTRQRDYYPFCINKATGTELAAFAKWCREYPDDADLDMDFDQLCEVIRSPWHFQTEWERFLKCQ